MRPRQLDLEAVREALARAEALVPKLPATKVEAAKVIPFRPRTPPPPPIEELAPSAWDPEPASDIDLVSARPAREEYEPRDEELLLQEINGCKTLLLEIIRRAAYDWVLYRGSRKMVQKALADQSFRWLFTEEPDTADWHERMREGKYITSFVAICEGLDLDPDTVRRHIKRLDRKNVMSVGRPAEYRRRDVFASRDAEDVYSLPGGLVEYNDEPDDGSTF